MSLHYIDGPKLRSVQQCVRAPRVQFEDPMLIENARNDLCQLHQGLMIIKEYSAKFRILVVKVTNWPESMKIKYFCNGLKAEIVAKAPSLRPANGWGGGRCWPHPPSEGGNWGSPWAGDDPRRVSWRFIQGSGVGVDPASRQFNFNLLVLV